MMNRAPLLPALFLAACTTEGPFATIAPIAPAAEPPPVETRTVAAPRTPAPAPAPDPQPSAAGAAPIIEEAEVLSTAPPPPETARTVEEFDTTTPEERAAAAAPDPAPAAGGDGRLGTTVASLGAAEEPGFWIKTPLVSQPTPGRLFYAASGRNVQVQLLPSGGASGSGSQVSLAAMRLLDAPLDGLPELVVFTN